MKFFADEIVHAFESNGNLHLILGVCSGKIDSEENDLKDEVATIIIPNSSVKKMSEDLQEAISALLAPSPPTPPKEKQSASKSKEFVGAGISIKIKP